MIIEQAINSFLSRTNQEDLREMKGLNRLNTDRTHGAKQFKKTKRKRKIANASKRRNRG